MGKIDHDSIDEINFSIEHTDSEIDEYLKLLDKDRLLILPEPYLKMCKTIGASGCKSLFSVPKHVLTNQINENITKLRSVLSDKENSEYLVTYMVIKRFIQRLSRASINKHSLTTLLTQTKNPSILKTLMSFLPEEDGKCKKIKYSMTNTSTGRLTVKEGPQILTAPSAVRDCLKSSHTNNKLLQVDIIAAEPKFALQLKGGNPPEDVYSHIVKNILEDSVDRQHAKLITLCALYGQSAKNLKDKLPENVSAQGVIRATRKYFDYKYLRARLCDEHNNKNFRNAVGRPIKINNDNEHLLISYYLQSSVAEASIMMFSDFIDKFSDYCEPVFIIHDALIIDCKAEFANFLLQKKRIKLSLGDWKFESEVKLVGDN